MKSVKWAVIYGLIVWAIPFVVAMLVFPLRVSDRPFFESIMPVAVVGSVVLCAVLYFRKTQSGSVRDGLLLGVVFLGISVIIDLAMFSAGPMAMPLVEYVKDIGFTYLLMPMITVGMGYVLTQRR